jgi:hypothetical protein
MVRTWYVRLIKGVPYHCRSSVWGDLGERNRTQKIKNQFFKMRIFENRKIKKCFLRNEISRVRSFRLPPEAKVQPKVSQKMNRSPQTKISNPYIGRPFVECRDAMITDENCQYPQIVTTCGTVMFCDQKGILCGKRLLDAPPMERDIQELAEVFDVVPKIKRPTIGCYQLKADFERRGLLITSPHIWNGSLIAAAYRAGIAIEPVWGSLNVKLGISRRWYREFLQAIENERYALDGNETK